MERVFAHEILMVARRVLKAGEPFHPGHDRIAPQAAPAQLRQIGAGGLVLFTVQGKEN